MILNLLFPNRCLRCSRIITSKEIVCELCFDQIHFTHYLFNANNLLKEKCRLLFPVENAYALMQFEEESLSREIVHQLKYGRREKIGKTLAEWVTERVDFGNDPPDFFITVPLHAKKLRKRGYNQLHLFADTLSKHYGIPCDHNLLKRNANRRAQATKDRIHRAETETLFICTREVTDKHILLVDDVFTTGNTMSSVAWEILKSGNNRISVLVMAEDY